MNPQRIEQLAKEAGFVQGPWANGNKERIWQENRDFPDAMEVFVNLIAKECVGLIKKEIQAQSEADIVTNVIGLNQAIYAIEDYCKVDP